MRKFALATGAFGVLAISVTWGAVAQDEAPKLTVKEVMNKAHGKDNLVKKLLLGMATPDEKDELVKLYVALAQNKPPRGDVASWKSKTTKLVEAAKTAAASSSKENLMALRATVDCMKCHDAHKGKQ